MFFKTILQRPDVVDVELVKYRYPSRNFFITSSTLLAAELRCHQMSKNASKTNLKKLNDKVRVWRVWGISGFEFLFSSPSIFCSGNLMGDGGARVLAKSIQINSKLKIIKFDRNNLTAAGFEEISNAMEKYFH